MSINKCYFLQRRHFNSIAFKARSKMKDIPFPCITLKSNQNVYRFIFKKSYINLAGERNIVPL